METNISKPQVTVKALIHLSLLFLSVTSLQTGVLGKAVLERPRANSGEAAAAQRALLSVCSSGLKQESLCRIHTGVGNRLKHRAALLWLYHCVKIYKQEITNVAWYKISDSFEITCGFSQCYFFFLFTTNKNSNKTQDILQIHNT